MKLVEISRGCPIDEGQFSIGGLANSNRPTTIPSGKSSFASLFLSRKRRPRSRSRGNQSFGETSIEEYVRRGIARGGCQYILQNSVQSSDDENEEKEGKGDANRSELRKQTTLSVPEEVQQDGPADEKQKATTDEEELQARPVGDSLLEEGIKQGEAAEQLFGNGVDRLQKASTMEGVADEGTTPIDPDCNDTVSSEKVRELEETTTLLSDEEKCLRSVDKEKNNFSHEDIGAIEARTLEITPVVTEGDEARRDEHGEEDNATIAQKEVAKPVLDAASSSSPSSTACVYTEKGGGHAFQFALPFSIGDLDKEVESLLRPSTAPLSRDDEPKKAGDAGCHDQNKCFSGAETVDITAAQQRQKSTDIEVTNQTIVRQCTQTEEEKEDAVVLKTRRSTAATEDRPESAKRCRLSDSVAFQFAFQSICCSEAEDADRSSLSLLFDARKDSAATATASGTATNTKTQPVVLSGLPSSEQTVACRAASRAKLHRPLPKGNSARLRLRFFESSGGTLERARAFLTA